MLLSERMGRPVSPALVLVSAPAVCQELAPRAYWPGPKGIKVFSIGYSYSAGDTSW